MFNSTFWIVVIVIGASIVAIGNIQFGLTRDREKSIAASGKAFSMLAEESRRNVSRVENMQKALSPTSIPIEGLETAAWNVMSQGGLLTQLETRTLQEITSAYYEVELANRYRAQLMELTVGIGAAMDRAPVVRQQYSELLKATLADLAPKLKAIAARAPAP